jgi:hypothetical protein
LKFTALDTVKFISYGWNLVSAQTIKKCFRHCGFGNHGNSSQATVRPTSQEATVRPITTTTIALSDPINTQSDDVENTVREVGELLASVSGVEGETVICEELDTFEQASSGDAALQDIIQDFKEEKAQESETQEEEEEEVEVGKDDAAQTVNINDAIKGLKDALNFAIINSARF